MTSIVENIQNLIKSKSDDPEEGNELAELVGLAFINRRDAEREIERQKQVAINGG